MKKWTVLFFRMKFIQQLFAIALVLCLAGCALTKGESAFATNAIKPTATTDPEPTASADTNPTTTDPIEIHPPPTEPPETESTQPPEVVQPEPDDEDFVRVRDYIPGIIVDLRYATDNNFTEQQIYDFTELWLRYGTVKKLMLVQEELKQSGLYLKVWDGFRPPSAQFKLWEVCPDPTYVSNPNNGFSSHSRGNTVDITLVYADGTEVVMPTGFDDFTKLADRDYSDCDQAAAANAMFLEQLMIKHGFKPYSGEWWHFSDLNSYPVEQLFEPVDTSWYYADCNEFISLRVKPTTSANVITSIPAYDEFQVLAVHGDFSLVDYNGLLGYVLNEYIDPIK